ncbi:MAG: hypothetical protein GY760_28175, partial [Deltaproteobacteria bacterium]|nr:hypothetical protein [Deltaproteobacteria bacterium]
MKENKLMISGFVSYAIFQMLGMLFALFTGRLDTLPSGFTWEKFIRLFITFSIGVGIMGIIVGHFFGRIQNRIPFENIYAKSISYNMAILLILSLFKGFSYLTSIDFVIASVSTVFIGWFFIWFYKLIGGSTSDNQEA